MMTYRDDYCGLSFPYFCMQLKHIHNFSLDNLHEDNTRIARFLICSCLNIFSRIIGSLQLAMTDGLLTANKLYYSSSVEYEYCKKPILMSTPL